MAQTSSHAMEVDEEPRETGQTTRVSAQATEVNEEAREEKKVEDTENLGERMNLMRLSFQKSRRQFDDVHRQSNLDSYSYASSALGPPMKVSMSNWWMFVYQREETGYPNWDERRDRAIGSAIFSALGKGLYEIKRYTVQDVYHHRTGYVSPTMFTAYDMVKGKFTSYQVVAYDTLPDVYRGAGKATFDLQRCWPYTYVSSRVPLKSLSGTDIALLDRLGGDFSYNLNPHHRLGVPSTEIPVSVEPTDDGQRDKGVKDFLEDVRDCILYVTKCICRDFRIPFVVIAKIKEGFREIKIVAGSRGKRAQYQHPMTSKVIDEVILHVRPSREGFDAAMASGDGSKFFLDSMSENDTYAPIFTEERWSQKYYNLLRNIAMWALDSLSQQVIGSPFLAPRAWLADGLFSRVCDFIGSDRYGKKILRPVQYDEMSFYANYLKIVKPLTLSGDLEPGYNLRIANIYRGEGEPEPRRDTSIVYYDEEDDEESDQEEQVEEDQHAKRARQAISKAADENSGSRILAKQARMPLVDNFERIGLNQEVTVTDAMSDDEVKKKRKGSDTESPVPKNTKKRSNEPTSGWGAKKREVGVDFSPKTVNAEFGDEKKMTLSRRHTACKFGVDPKNPDLEKMIYSMAYTVKLFFDDAEVTLWRDRMLTNLKDMPPEGREVSLPCSVIKNIFCILKGYKYNGGTKDPKCGVIPPYAILTKESKFLDIGSGLGRVVVSAAIILGCEVRGIEKDKEKADFSKGYIKALMADHGYPLQNVQVRFGKASGLAERAKQSGPRGYTHIYAHDESFGDAACQAIANFFYTSDTVVILVTLSETTMHYLNENRGKVKSSIRKEKSSFTEIYRASEKVARSDGASRHIVHIILKEITESEKTVEVDANASDGQEDQDKGDDQDGEDTEVVENNEGVMAQSDY